jgi:hypothetical protein
MFLRGIQTMNGLAMVIPSLRDGKVVLDTPLSAFGKYLLSPANRRCPIIEQAAPMGLTTDLFCVVVATNRPSPRGLVRACWSGLSAACANSRVDDPTHVFDAMRVV